jgi:hypothetical protein
MNWQSKLSITFFLAALLLAAAMTVFAAPQEEASYLAPLILTEHGVGPLATAAPDFPLGNPICQTGWSITQEYLDRKADGTIWRRTSIYRCIPQPKVQWKKRHQQIRRAT